MWCLREILYRQTYNILLLFGIYISLVVSFITRKTISLITLLCTLKKKTPSLNIFRFLLHWFVQCTWCIHFSLFFFIYSLLQNTKHYSALERNTNERPFNLYTILNPSKKDHNFTFYITNLRRFALNTIPVQFRTKY